MEQHIDYFIQHFGYFGITIIFIGGIIGIPIPDEALLTYIGFNVFQGKLSFSLSLLSAFVGSVIGITLSYLIGSKLGLPFLKKYGPYFHLTDQRITRTMTLFNKIGPPLLLIGYFIPGVRHITAIVAAINSYPFKKFVIYAYIGALIWSGTFITLGKELGKEWSIVALYISKYSISFILLLSFALVVFYIVWMKKNPMGIVKNSSEE